MAKLRFKWEVDDGYVGRDRPQTTSVDVSEINDCETLEEAVALVEDAIQSDFEQKISACYDQQQIEDAVAAVFKK